MATAAAPAGRTGMRSASVAVVLVVLGVVLWLAYRLAAGAENHAYSPNAIPPDYVHVTVSHSYDLSYPGGVRGMTAQGLDPASLDCTWSEADGAKQTLVVDGYAQDAASRDAVASFQAPATASIHITCDGLGAMFVDDADDAAGDPSGWFLVASTLALTLGAVLVMSVLYRAPRAVDEDDANRSASASAWAAGEDDEVERLVRIVHERAADDEAGGTDDAASGDRDRS